MSCVFFVSLPKASTIPCPQSVHDDHRCDECMQAWKGGPCDGRPRIQTLSSQALWPHNQWLDAMVQTGGIILLPFSLFKANRLFWEACQTKHLDCPFYEGKKSLRDQGEKLKKDWNTPHGGHHYFKMLDFVTGVIYPLNAWSTMGRKFYRIYRQIPCPQ